MVDHPKFEIVTGQKLAKVKRKTSRQEQADKALAAWNTGNYNSKRSAIKSIDNFGDNEIRYLHYLLKKRITGEQIS